MKLRLDDGQRRVLRLLRHAGPTSRSGISSELGLTPTSMTQLSRSLMDLDLVEETEADRTERRGRRATPLRISARGGYAMGVAVHRGLLELAVIDYAGGLVDHSTQAFDELAPRACARLVRQRLYEMADRNSLLGRRFFGFGIGIPGGPRPDDGERWITVRSLVGWRDEPLRTIFENELGEHVWVENDGNAAALAEHHLGNASGRTSTELVILLGHGLGAGVVAEGSLLRGAAGNTGDIGCLFPGNRPRPSTIDLLDTLREAGCAAESALDVEAAMVSHGELVTSWIERAADQLRGCIDAGIAWLNPGRVVVSSPLPRSLLERLVERLNTAVWEDGYYVDYPVSVEISRLGGMAIAFGAAMLPIHAVEAAR